MADVETILAPKKSDLPVRIVSAVVMLAILGVALWLNNPVKMWLIVIVALVCFVEFVLLVTKATQNVPFRLAGILAGAVYIGLAGVTMVNLQLQAFGAAIGAVVFTDVFAYFTGRAIGGPKIAPSISPSKTWAGLIGGMIGAALFMVCLGIVHFSVQGYTLADMGAELPIEFGTIMLVGAGLAVVAQMGDFFESWLKRKADVKDSSKLIPGHGGVFDRIDGLLPVSIVVGTLANLFGA
ncbi:phosphatidate cytidylyltransferase [Parerythrobacter jejuensis]|uniref:Phosphatidate cytidylyltransferase n=1 Tax=Parerythrobacter jejuensis TaxID=795812 RepID=A0A845AS92_9SPHN|nr:phosphatidate cytidylyltransferase [Parerythrobacter jejuensis]MXP32043.1 phosphatidate cytidylyltransferase [Parerythrobacter jejuensis]